MTISVVSDSAAVAGTIDDFTVVASADNDVTIAGVVAWEVHEVRVWAHLFYFIFD